MENIEKYYSKINQQTNFEPFKAVPYIIHMIGRDYSTDPDFFWAASGALFIIISAISNDAKIYSDQSSAIKEALDYFGSNCIPFCLKGFADKSFYETFRKPKEQRMALFMILTSSKNEKVEILSSYLLKSDFQKENLDVALEFINKKEFDFIQDFFSQVATKAILDYLKKKFDYRKVLLLYRASRVIDPLFKQKMNLVLIFIFIYPFLFIHSALLSSDELLKLDVAIAGWKNQIVEKGNVMLLDESIALVSSITKVASSNIELLNQIYSLALETIANSDQFYSVLDERRLHKIFSNIYSLSEVFANHLTNQELVHFFYISINCIFKHGTDWKFSSIFIKSPSDEMIIEIIGNVGEFFKVDSELKGKDALISFYFYFIDMAKFRGLIKDIVTSEHVMNSLLYVHKHTDHFMTFFHQWVESYFPFIHKVFERHLVEPSKVKALLDLSKTFVNESDVDWAVLIFSANDLAEFIYSNPLLLGKALDILSLLMERYTDRFMACVELLGVKRAKRIADELKTRTIKKKQILTALLVRKLLPRLKLDTSLPLEEAFESWKSALEEINRIKLDDLSPEDFENISDIIGESYENLYAEFKENESENVLRVLNAYIPINAKLNVFFKIGLDSAAEISSKYVDISAIEFSKRKKEIDLRELAIYVNNFQCSVLGDEERFIQLTKYTEYWNLNSFSFKVFVDFMINLNWFHEQVPIRNVQKRIIKYLNSNRNHNERREIKDIVDYLHNDLKIISKTEAILLNISINK